jgi:hypothetical protein
VVVAVRGRFSRELEGPDNPGHGGSVDPVRAGVEDFFPVWAGQKIQRVAPEFDWTKVNFHD